MLYEDTTKKILEACFEVGNELGFGYLESVYEKALLIALRQKGLRAENQVPLKVKFRGEVVGEFFVDILIEEKVLVELKVANGLSKENYAQVINYLKATEIEVGLLINFGTPRIEYRRFTNKFNENQTRIRDVFK
ncbi:MAG: GxxExxY protein [Pyrinomonadaceae bacterium]